MKIYLGGPIRNDNRKDFAWRGDIRSAYANIYDFEFLDPIANNLDDELSPDIKNPSIYALDKAMMQKCDAGVFNLIPMTLDNYPCHGALMEIGFLLALNKAVWVVAPYNNPLRSHPMYCQCTFVPDFETLYRCF